jgi:Tol biopolymer transport system component
MNGTVAFVVDGQPPRELVWRDRSGKRLGSALSAFRELFGVALAPHGRAVVFRYTNAENRGETRLIDVERSQDTRLFAPPLSPSYVVWSPDGARILFSGDVAGNVGLYARNVSGGPEELLLKQAESPRRPSDWSRDGRWIVYTENDRNTRGDIWLLPTPPNASAGKAVPLLRTAANESEGQISPDGRWLAYTSDEAGFEQVYLRPFTGSEPVPDVKWSITAAGRAVEPRWRADGRELYWLERNATRRTTYALVAVPINEAPNPVGAPIRLFELQTTSPVIQNNSFTYSPSADGQRFLISGFAADARPSLDVILNWPASLKN